MEKAIEIKRRAQRCIQNGDLDGALNEYEKLVQAQDSDPYNFVLLADLQFKRGDSDQAVQRYLAAVGSYEKAGLFKNAIAVCKKMMRLSLAPAKVLERLAALHALDGLGAEATLYYMQYAETMVRDGRPKDAAEALQRAFDASPDEVKALERMSEAWMLAEEPAQAARAMGAAAYAYERIGRLDQVDRCRRRAEQLHPGVMDQLAVDRGPLTGLVVEEEEPEAPVAESEPAADAGATRTAEAVEAGLDLVSPMAPPRTASHLAGGDLELERVPHGVFGAGAPGSPPRLESGSDGAAANGSRSEDDGHRGPPPLPAALAHGHEAAAGTIGTADAPAVDESSGDDADAVYEIADDGTEFAAAAPEEDSGRIEDADENANEDPAPVYEIALEEAGDEAAPLAYDTGEPAMPEEPPVPTYTIEEEAAPWTEEVAATGADPAFEPEPVAAEAGSGGTPGAPAPAGLTIAEIEGLLSGAQERFRAGDREGAAGLLVDAAIAYERAGRLENAASIFRSLARGPQTSARLMELWLANCERREDRREAAEVACELGDRSLNEGDLAGAGGWFARACDRDPDNAVARRRLSRLAGMAPSREAAAEPAAAIVAPAPAAPAPAPEPAPARAPRAAVPEPDPAMAGDGRVEMSVGRAEAVSFDLGALLSEFQRGIEAQLSGDAQSHYDLAMTYREMGLHAQAVEGFRLAASDPAFAYRAAEMIGRCLLDQGRFDEAVHEFSEALRSPKLAAEAVLGLRFQLGLAHEAGGNREAALAEFERVFEQQANYSDVSLKIRSLRTSLGRA